MMIIRIDMIDLSVIRSLIAFAAPNTCTLCHTPLEDPRKVVCAPCFGKLPLLDSGLIAVLKEEIPEPCFRDITIPFEFSAPFQKLIYLLKYRRCSVLGKYFGEVVAGMIRMREYDLITAVPLHPARLRERGFNQSALIAHHLSTLTGIPFNAKLLRRDRNNPSQTRLSRENRRQNVNGLFSCPFDLKQKKILVVDDVVTTGSTLNACCKSLILSGADCIDVTALATPAGILQRESVKTRSDFRIFQEFS